MKSLIDLHMHSLASDGEDTTAELWSKIKGLGIRCFALTDHDTVDGVREMEGLIAADERADVSFIRGIEFSCFTPAGKCHILGYGYDMDHPAFLAVLKKSADLRRGKLERRLEFLREEYEIEFTEDVIEAWHQMSSVGKPHIAEQMVNMGKAVSVGDAIENYIDHCPTKEFRMPADEVILAVKAAGGIAVWAHPYGDDADESKYRSDEDFRAQLKCLLGLGIQGLECYYSRYTKTRIETLAACALENGMYISGGSDYHGKKEKPDLGTLNADGICVNPSQLTVLRPLNIGDFAGKG